MNLKKERLKKSRLYLILDKKTAGNRPLAGIINEIKTSGVDLIQLRAKEIPKEAVLREAFLLSKRLGKSRQLLIINDYPHLARLAGADGVHLGQADWKIEKAREILGKDKIIGISCHTLKQALAAEKQGADYLGFGPLFPTPTKSEYKPIGLKLIRKLKSKIKIPFFVIGNINLGNLNSVLLAGAKRVALCRAILKSKDIAEATKEFSRILKKNPLRAG